VSRSHCLGVGGKGGGKRESGQTVVFRLKNQLPAAGLSGLRRGEEGGWREHSMERSYCQHPQGIGAKKARTKTFIRLVFRLNGEVRGGI